MQGLKQVFRSNQFFINAIILMYLSLQTFKNHFKETILQLFNVNVVIKNYIWASLRSANNYFEQFVSVYIFDYNLDAWALQIKTTFWKIICLNKFNKITAATFEG